MLQPVGQHGEHKPVASDANAGAEPLQQQSHPSNGQRLRALVQFLPPEEPVGAPLFPHCLHALQPRRATFYKQAGVRLFFSPSFCFDVVWRRCGSCVYAHAWMHRQAHMHAHMRAHTPVCNFIFTHR